LADIFWAKNGGPKFTTKITEFKISQHLTTITLKNQFLILPLLKFSGNEDLKTFLNW